MLVDKFNLARFLVAQEGSYDLALNELRSGRKRSHWMWYDFPQPKGLGQSTNSQLYGISGLAEARAYIRHPVIGKRLLEAIGALLVNPNSDAISILGELDALKLKSCLTLFSVAQPSEKIFRIALDRLFDGHFDVRTLDLIKGQVG